MSILDLLPIEIIGEIAACSWHVYRGLVISYPRFGRTIDQSKLKQFHSLFIRYDVEEISGLRSSNSMSTFGVAPNKIYDRAGYTTLSGEIRSIGGRAAIKYKGFRYYVFKDHIRLDDRYTNDAYPEQYRFSSCAYHRCINNLIWGADLIKQKQSQATVDEIIHKRIFYSNGKNTAITTERDNFPDMCTDCTLVEPADSELAFFTKGSENANAERKLPPLRVAFEQIREDCGLNNYGILIMHNYGKIAPLVAFYGKEAVEQLNDQYELLCSGLGNTW